MCLIGRRPGAEITSLLFVSRETKGGVPFSRFSRRGRHDDAHRREVASLLLVIVVLCCGIIKAQSVNGTDGGHRILTALVALRSRMAHLRGEHCKNWIVGGFSDVCPEPALQPAPRPQ